MATDGGPAEGTDYHPERDSDASPPGIEMNPTGNDTPSTNDNNVNKTGSGGIESIRDVLISFAPKYAGDTHWKLAIIGGGLILLLIWHIILLAVDELTKWNANDSDTNFVLGAGELRSEISGSKDATTYDESCDDGNDDLCDLKGRGICWIIINICLLTLHCFLIILVIFEKQAKMLVIVCAINIGLILLACMVWSIANPFDDETFLGSGFSLGASWWMAMIMIIAYGGYALYFMHYKDDPPSYS